MAEVNISIRRDNGTTVAATAQVEDRLVVDLSMTLAALLFDSASKPAAETPTPNP